MIEDSCAIRPMVASDLEAVVEIHIESFPGFFLTFLGHNFLALLYKSIHCDPEGVVLVVASNARIEGFAAGVAQQMGFYDRLIKKHKWAFAVAALKALIKRPTIAQKLLRALNRPHDVQESAAEASLMSIAVRPDAEGKGIGRGLVRAFCQTLVERGIGTVALTTDRDNNERANRFYQRLGFCLSRSYLTPDGRAMNEYVMSLREHTDQHSPLDSRSKP